MSKNKFTVAIIGVGGRGGYAYGTLISQLPNQFEIVALCDINTEKLSFPRFVIWSLRIGSYTLYGEV